ncbi:MAG TPA: dienelactone hydrolase family protein [Acidimicrobiales bacterium]|nr:dienelactone hydrolase family protein [Acidimicrobiales bacterium]
MTTSTPRWLGDPLDDGGVTERPFLLDVEGRSVPALLWTPTGATGARPLVLFGHGATRHKRVDYILALASRLAGGHGFAAVAIDAPGHGDRRSAPADDLQVFSEFLAEWSREGSVDDMLAEWAATIEVVRSLDEVGDGPLGYWGLSMGTIYGVPLVATDARVQAAVFGLMGLVGPTRERLAADAARVACPVTFIQQWDDSLLPRQEVLDLFDALGSLDKRLHAHPGDHAAVPLEELEFSVAFLARHLGEGG